ncbi:Ig-like domain-containing protein [Kiritimatiellaeota bacterium B1221]|nr:Ig-like domain-containing protein [Kiritimatiellaeota bacterium B1221]
MNHLLLHPRLLLSFLFLGFLQLPALAQTATILANSIKLGQGGATNHDDYFEDYSGSVVLTNGNIVSAWRARDNSSASPVSPDGDDYGIFFKILSPTGALVAGPTAPYLDINSSGTGEQNGPRLTALSGGGFAIAWNSLGGPGDVDTDGDGGDAYVRVYSNSGTAVSGTSKINESEPSGTNDGQYPLEMIGLSDGGFAVVWVDANDSTGNKDDYFVRAYNANGSARGASLRMGTNHDAYFERFGGVVALGSGKFATTWSTDDPVFSTPGTPGADGDLESALFFRVFNANGSAATNPIRPYLSINSTGAGRQASPSITALTNGNFALIWNSASGPGDVFVDTYGYGGDTYTAVFTPTGTLVGSVSKVNDLQTDNEELPTRVEALTGGGYVVVWKDDESDPDPNKDDYYVRVYSATGTAINASLRVSPNSDAMFEDFGSLAVLADGGFVVSMRIRDSNNNGTGSSVDGGGAAGGIRIFNANGTARTPLFFPYLDINSDGSGSQNTSLVAADPSGGFAVAWNSTGNSNDGAASNDYGTGSNSTSGGDTWARFYNNQGVAQVGTVRVHASSPGELTGTIDEQMPSSVVTGLNGNWAVVFRDGNDNTGNKDDMYVTILSGGAVSNAAPSFNDGATTTLTVNENGGATSINNRLDINDSDSGDSLTWSVTSGPSKGSLGGFNASGTSNGGNVTPSGLTYTPTANNIGSDSFTVQVSDGTDTDSITINVTISDVNPTITANSGSIAENASINDTVLTMSATGDTNGLTWSLAGGTPFAINSSTGAVRVNAALDRETTPSYTLSISVDDEDGGSTADDTVSVVVTITDINDTAPVITSNGGGASDAINVNEGTSAVTTVSATDADTTGSVSYEIVSVGDHNDFSIHSTSGVLTFASTPDYENPTDADLNNIYVVTVRATDGTQSDDQELTVTVINMNDTPTVDNAVANFAVNEDAANTVLDLTHIFSDLEDADSDLTYTVESNNNVSLVSAAVNPASDQLTLDYQANQNGTAVITIRATDSGALFVEDSFTVTVNAINDPPTVTNAVADFTLNEDAADTVLDLTQIFSDLEDADSDLTYTIESNSNASLVSPGINAGTDELTLDYQADQNGTAIITVRATDSGALFVEDSFTVTLNAVNDTPTVENAVADFAVNEDAADTVINLTDLFSDVEDADADLTFTIASNNNPSLLAASVNGGTDELTLAYQANQNGTATVTVRATDSGALFVEDSFTVTVNIVNDTPTVDNAVADFAVNEDAADTVLDLTSIFSDVEDADADLTYTVESNNNTSLVTASVNVGNDELTLDYQDDQNGTATIRIRATDSGALFVEDVFTVTVNDVNDNPTLTNAVADYTVDEDAADTVLDLTSIFSDVEDADSDLIYTVESNNNATLIAASVNATSDELTLAYLSNQNGSATLTIRATDAGALFIEDTFTVTVNAVNDTPAVDNAVADFAVDEDAADTVLDLTGIFSDVEDADGDLIYSVEANNNTSLLTASVNAGSDELTLNYQTNQFGTATVTVRATDSGALFIEDTFTVTVNSVNDIPAVDNAVADFTVDEDAANTVFDLTHIFSDIEDADTALTYTVESNNNTGLVTTLVNAGTDELSLDYQANQNGTAVITVRATDSGALFIEDSFTVTVNAVNDTPTVSNAVADYAVDEDAVDTVFDLTLLFSDIEDADSDLIYTVESNNNTTLLTTSVDAGSDELTLDYLDNQFGTATITVRATDSGSLFVEDSFTVTVNAVNDTPVVSNAVADFTVNEDATDTVLDLTNIFSDIEDADSDLIYTVESNSNASLVTANVNSTSDQLTLDYQANQTGTATLTVRATDSGALLVEDTFTITVNKLVDITLVATESVDPVLAGNGLPGNLVHQINVTNNGPSDATTAVINFSQTLPTGVTLVSAVPSSGSIAGADWTIPALAESQMATLTFTMSVPATVVGGADSIITTGSVTSITEPLTATGDDSDTVKTSVASPETTGFDLETGLIGNFSNSLIEQLVKVTNNNPSAVPAFRIVVSGLPSDVTLFNAHGTTSGGKPFVVWNQELAASATAEILMQYYRASGVTNFTPVYTVEFLTAAEADALLDPPAVGPALSVVRFVKLADGAMLLEWASVPGKKYYIQYSSDLSTYTTVLPGLTAGATRTRWIDRGPPQTESHPSVLTGARYYRVMEAQ